MKIKKSQMLFIVLTIVFILSVHLCFADNNTIPKLSVKKISINNTNSSITEKQKTNYFTFDFLILSLILFLPVLLGGVCFFAIYNYHTKRTKCVFLYENLDIEIKNLKPNATGEITYKEMKYFTSNTKKRFFNGAFFRKPIFMWKVGLSTPLNFDLTNNKKDNALGEYYHQLQEKKLWINLLKLLSGTSDMMMYILMILGIITSIGILIVLLLQFNVIKLK